MTEPFDAQTFVKNGFRVMPAANGGIILHGELASTGYERGTSDRVAFTSPEEFVKWLSAAYAKDKTPVDWMDRQHAALGKLLNRELVAKGFEGQIAHVTRAGGWFQKFPDVIGTSMPEDGTLTLVTAGEPHRVFFKKGEWSKLHLDGQLVAEPGRDNK